MPHIYVGTVFANDTNGRVVELPQGYQIARITETPGKKGSGLRGLRIDYLLPVRLVTEEDVQALQVPPEPDEPAVPEEPAV